MSSVPAAFGRLIGIVLLALLALLPSADWAMAQQAMVQETVRTYRVVRVDQDDVLNIRTGPSGGARVVGTIPPGGRGVHLVGDCSSWCPIRYNGVSGWVNGRYLAIEPAVAQFVRRPALPSHWQVTGVPANETLQVREGPSLQARVVHVYPPSATCIVFLGDCQKPFCQVKFPAQNGAQTGWVDARFLAPAEEPCT